MNPAVEDSLQQLQHLPARWPSLGNTVPWVAFVIGLLIFVISYFAGGRQQQRKIIFATVFSVVIGALCVPLFDKLEIFVSGLFGAGTARIVVMLLFMLYVVAVGIHLYEIITVTAREAHPTSNQW
jgi:hypothetical protein